MINDPYEYVNLYNSTHPSHIQAKSELYNLLPDVMMNSKHEVSNSDKINKEMYSVWRRHGYKILPWAKTASLRDINDVKSYPKLC